MKTLQYTLTLPAKTRGLHLITDLLAPYADKIETGLMHLFLQHTSASLLITENYDPDVRRDFESLMRTLIPDGWEGFRHTLEGADDMPAHIKSALFGVSLTLPVSDGKLSLGTWQGVYVYEHRDYASPRRILITLQGE